ncbi:hypothetical protein AMTR_s00016p00099800, partial [Amborella trichopoda]
RGGKTSKRLKQQGQGLKFMKGYQEVSILLHNSWRGIKRCQFYFTIHGGVSRGVNSWRGIKRGNRKVMIGNGRIAPFGFNKWLIRRPLNEVDYDLVALTIMLEATV